MTCLLCIGAGYSARAVAEAVIAAGGTVVGTSRTPEGAARLAERGIDGLVFNADSDLQPIRAALARATHVLVSVAPDPGSDTPDPTLARLAADLAAAGHLDWIGYLSTVGVYGDHNGGWVDETTEPAPRSPRSVARLAAEDAWRALADASTWRLHIYRLAGIYGPGRSPLQKIRNGTARRIIKPGQVFNRIHAADITQAVLAGMAGRGTDTVYNVTDDEPAPPQDVIAFAAECAGLPVPAAIEFKAAELSPMARSFYGENKRVSNARLRDELGVVLRFPTYREGIRALAADA